MIITIIIIIVIIIDKKIIKINEISYLKKEARRVV